MHIAGPIPNRNVNQDYQDATKEIIACAIAATLSASCTAYADNNYHQGPFKFEPITESAYNATWTIPEGFTQTVVSDESDLNIYDNGRDDLNDMNVVNETGKQAGRFMYRTHEVRAGSTYVELKVARFLWWI